MTITLGPIKTKQKQVTPAGITLAEGERYVCSVTRPDGKTTHTILLPGDSDVAKWAAQMEWVNSIGGDLPTQIELLLLFELMKEDFRESTYWSNTSPGNSDSAWVLDFYDGNQYYDHKSYSCRARAVRRLVI